MSSKPHDDKTQYEQVYSQAKNHRKQREHTYREKALKMFDWVCGKCGREFSGKKLKELTVHHKDHNHDNNPPDGSNWELLCIYCHENEHDRMGVAESYSGERAQTQSNSSGLDSPFAGLGDLLKKEEES